ncbi:phage holin family protein [Actinoplanes sp. NPDC051346]|uniref:phage holin family protein n=1 Tax=Actinoplanes sp. NPDC051346 TaxID=3155048 RepID=UPI003448BD19
MTVPYPTDHDRAEEVSATSVGELIGNISDDLSQLFRQEVELAKAELKQEAAKAGKAAGMLGGAGFAGYLAVVLLSLALVFGLGNVMDLGWAALIVAVLWGVAGAVLYVTGRKQLKTVDPMPRRTVDTLKEDAQWLKNPTG